MKRSYQIVDARRNRSRKILTEQLVKSKQVLLPLVDALVVGKEKIDQTVSEVTGSLLEALLIVSAEQVAGERRRGKRGEAIRWHGEQDGLLPLSDRKVRVKKPRLRQRKVGKGGEVHIPAYEAMWENAELRDRVLEIAMHGVSTRDYEGVLPKMAAAVGMKKSSVSRELIEASSEALRALHERRWDREEFLILYLDGIQFGKYHVLGAVGVDREGRKQVLGIREGASENATVVTALLEDLVARGLKTDRQYLFVIDGSKALRAAIAQVFGDRHFIQRCRNHKVRNVMDHLPEELRDQTKKVMKAAFKLEPKKGKEKLEQQAKWLEIEYPSAAASLREGMDEMFTVQRLGLSSMLSRCLTNTNLIDSAHSGVRMKTRRVTHWQHGEMVMRWAAASFLATEKQYRRIQGYRDLWMLEAALSEEVVQAKAA